MSRNRETSLATNLHARNSRIPAFDDFTSTQSEFERLTFVALVENLALL
jgi:hypothetical protein